MGASDFETDIEKLYNIRISCMLVQGKLYVRLSCNIYNILEDFLKLEKAVNELRNMPKEEKRQRGYDIPIMHWDLSPFLKPKL